MTNLSFEEQEQFDKAYALHCPQRKYKRALKMTQETKPTCSYCKDTGIMEYFELDGMTIYRWQKPLKKPCRFCEASKRKPNDTISH